LIFFAAGWVALIYLATWPASVIKALKAAQVLEKWSAVFNS